MRRSLGVFFLALVSASAAMAAGAAPCAVRKGLYENWLAFAKHVSPRTGAAQEALVAPGTASRGDIEAPKQTDIGGEYNAFFQCLSNLAEQQTGGEAVESCCQEAGADPVAALVCRMTAYLKGS